MSKCSSADTLHHYVLGYICRFCGDSTAIKQEVKAVSARESSELIEAMENAIHVLEDVKQQMIPPAKPSSFWVLFWEPRGEGGAAIEGLKMMVKRLRERGN